MPCKACSVRNVKQLANNKHMDKCKKATRAGKRIFPDSVTIKAPLDRGIIITNKTGTLLWTSPWDIRSWSSIVPSGTNIQKNLASGK